MVFSKLIIGTYIYEDGSKYEGTFKDGKIDGNGIFSYNDGDTYDGEWKNGKFNGNGIIILF